MAQLANVILDICIRCGYAAENIDVSAITGTVTGFCLSNRSSARAMLEPLMKAFFFDAVESADSIKFIPLDQEYACDPISVDELIPLDGGEGVTGQNYFKVNRADDAPLPRTLDLNYVSKAADYEQGTQSAMRQTADSGESTTETLAVVMTDDEARQVAQKLLYLEWIGRSTFDFALPIKYLRLEPGDLIPLTDGNFTHSVRILRKKVFGSAIVYEGKALDVSVFTQTISGGDTTVTGSTVADPGDTILHLLDLPMLREADNNAGFYIACGRTLAAWRGARVYRSLDDAEYASLISVPASCTTGVASGALATGPTAYMDRKNSVTVVTDFTASLTSATLDNLLAGTNAALLGNEIIQFQTATLIAERTYTLSGLLRGRLGTEWAVGEHAAGERFVLLSPSSNMVRVADGSGLIGASRYYKAVSVGLSIDTVDDPDVFINTARGLIPWSPAHFRGVSNEDGDWLLSWKRRTRFGGAWRDGVDVPLNEETEAYTLEILDGEDIVETITVSAASSYTYTAAQQTATFGAPVSTLSARISQNSAVAGPGQRTQEVFSV